MRSASAAADGNPLFVQELAAMLEESSDESIATPPTIQALLAARLDQLDPDERTVLEAAAVEGEVFHLDAVRALTPDEPLTAKLTALVRKEFVRPYRPAFEGEDGFRFRHLLLRDATYDAIPKAARSGLHERYADWLEQRGDGLDAFVGYHLEQAYRYRVDLRDASAERRSATGFDTARRRRDGSPREERLTGAIGLLDARRPCHPSPRDDAHGSRSSSAPHSWTQASSTRPSVFWPRRGSAAAAADTCDWPVSSSSASSSRFIAPTQEQPMACAK